MEMLLDESDEFGVNAGLGLIPGRVVPVPPVASDGRPQKIPHIGWGSLVLPRGRHDWRDTLLDGIERDQAVYFVHSYMALPDNPEHRVADCLYGGMPVTAVVARANVTGFQFHPEKSGDVGLGLLGRFMRL